MPITVKWFGLGLLNLLDTPTDMEQVTSKLALTTSAYTPNQDTDDFRNDFTTNEVANGNGYATGGVTLTTPTWSYDSASDQVRLDFDDAAWVFTAAKTWRHGVLFIDTAGADSTDPLVAYLTWDADQTVSTAYTLQMDPAGLLYLDLT